MVQRGDKLDDRRGGITYFSLQVNYTFSSFAFNINICRIGWYCCKKKLRNAPPAPAAVHQVSSECAPLSISQVLVSSASLTWVACLVAAYSSAALPGRRMVEVW